MTKKQSQMMASQKTSSNKLDTNIFISYSINSVTTNYKKTVNIDSYANQG